MDKLHKAHEAIETLKSLGVPISSELMKGIAKMEREYLADEVSPLLERELLPLVKNMKTRFQMDVTYSKEDGLNVNLLHHSPKVLKQQPQKRKHQENETYRQKLRVTFPNKRVSCENTVWKTLMEVIRYAGPKNVQKLGIKIMGLNIVSNRLYENKKFHTYQKEIKPGLYLCTLSSTNTKYDLIKKINRCLNLGLTIEKVML